MSNKSHIVPQNTRKQYLNEYLPSVFGQLSSKTRAKKAIMHGEVLVNGRQVSVDYFINSGDKIEVISKATSNKKIFQEKLEVVFEDDYMAIINKPGGLPVNGNTFKTLENALPYNLKKSKSADALPFPLPVHRLDVPTCGLVMVAKTVSAQIKLGKDLQNKNLSKQYHAVAIGSFKEKKGIIDLPIENKPCTTEYEVLTESKSAQYGMLSYVALYPITGRTHQLRIHLSEIGHSIIGDEYYTKGAELLRGKGLFLCAVQLDFNHPITDKKLQVKISAPPKFKKYMEREAFGKFG